MPPRPCPRREDTLSPLHGLHHTNGRCFVATNRPSVCNVFASIKREAAARGCCANTCPRPRLLRQHAPPPAAAAPTRAPAHGRTLPRSHPQRLRCLRDITRSSPRCRRAAKRLKVIPCWPPGLRASPLCCHEGFGQRRREVAQPLLKTAPGRELVPLRSSARILEVHLKG